jgi:hypothetical protein
VEFFRQKTSQLNGIGRLRLLTPHASNRRPVLAGRPSGRPARLFSLSFKRPQVSQYLSLFIFSRLLNSYEFRDGDLGLDSSGDSTKCEHLRLFRSIELFAMLFGSTGHMAGGASVWRRLDFQAAFSRRKTRYLAQSHFLQQMPPSTVSPRWQLFLTVEAG